MGKQLHVAQVTTIREHNSVLVSAVLIIFWPQESRMRLLLMEFLFF